jgi:hypothetical protein
MINLDTHLVVGAHNLKMTNFATFVASFVFHVAAFDSNIGWFSSLVAIFVEIFTLAYF